MVDDGPVCKPNGPFCKTLMSRLEEYYKYKGIGLMELSNLETGKKTRTFIIHTMKNPKPDVLVLNYCPWCGGKLLDDNNNLIGDGQ